MRGPAKGSIFPLPEGEFSVGRHASNSLCLEETAVSRRHCVIERTGACCVLKDLESRNGTFVNGTPITEQALAQGDEIRIGGSIFSFLVDTDRVVVLPKLDTKTRELRFEDSAYLSSSDRTILPPSARALHDLRTLLRVSTMLHSFRDTQNTSEAPAAEALANPFGIAAAGHDSSDPRWCVYSGCAAGPSRLGPERSGVSTRL